MNPENFCYWLQGWLELQNPQAITALQVKEIQNHLDLVFTKVTPKLFPIAPEPTYCDCATGPGNLSFKEIMIGASTGIKIPELDFDGSFAGFKKCTCGGGASISNLSC